MDTQTLTLLTLIALALLALIVVMMAHMAYVDILQLRAQIVQLVANTPMVLTDALFETLRGATFAILDDHGHPVCCGFYVTPCGVALTVARACVYARPAGGPGSSQVLRTSTHQGREFTLGVACPMVGALDVAVLRVCASAALPPRSHLPLPSVRHSPQQLLGAPVALVHGSIAWSAGASVKQIARNDGRIITSSKSLLHYSVDKGHSGAALLFRGGQVIGLHSQGFNDLDDEHSERSPSTSADAVRLDVPEIWSAVQAASAAAPAAAAGRGAARRRKASLSS